MYTTEINDIFHLGDKERNYINLDILSYLGLTNEQEGIVPDITNENSIDLIEDIDNEFYSNATLATSFDDLYFDILRQDFPTYNSESQFIKPSFEKHYQIHTSDTLFHTTNSKHDDELFILRSPSVESDTQSEKSECEYKVEKPKDSELQNSTRRKPNNCYHLWDFLYDILDGKIKPKQPCIEWVDDTKKEFRITNTAVLSDMWGVKKHSKNPMTYDKLSRTLRYYCSLDILKRIPGKRLQFQFGNGRMWNKSFKRRQSNKKKLLGSNR